MTCARCSPRLRSSFKITIITTCKNLGIDPRCYIRDTLRRILHGEKDIEALLPENYAPRADSDHTPSATQPRAA